MNKKNRLMRAMLLGSLTLSILLTSCGQKGPLYIDKHAGKQLKMKPLKTVTFQARRSHGLKGYPLFKYLSS